MLSVYLRPPEEELADVPPVEVKTPGAGRGAPLPGPVLGITGPSPRPPNSISFVTRRLTQGTNWFAMLMGIVSFIALYRFKADVLWVVLAGGVIGLVWTLLGMQA